MEYKIKQYNTPNLPRDYYVCCDGKEITDPTPNKDTAEMMVTVQSKMNDGIYRTYRECETLNDNR